MTIMALHAPETPEPDALKWHERLIGATTASDGEKFTVVLGKQGNDVFGYVRRETSDKPLELFAFAPEEARKQVEHLYLAYLAYLATTNSA